MAAKTRDSRNAAATKLLDYGFANFATYRAPAGERVLPARGGAVREGTVRWDAVCVTVPKGSLGRIEVLEELPEVISAPVAQGDEVGALVYRLDGDEIARVPVLATQDIEKMGFGALFLQLLSSFLLI